MMFRRFIYSLSLFFLFIFNLTAAPNLAERLFGVQTGDLLFLDLKCGPICDAIADVTRAQFGDGPRMSHVGMLVVEEGGTFLYEALPRAGVVRTKIEDLWKRVGTPSALRGRLWIGRFRAQYREMALDAARNIKNFVGRPYDPTFYDWSSDSSFSCAKLIARSFAPHRFTPKPMYFGVPGTPTRQFWDGYFKAHRVATPDGMLGISPLGLYLQGASKYFL